MRHVLKEYKTVASTSLEQLQQDVSGFITQGWEPFKEVVVYNTESEDGKQDINFLQAIIRFEYEEENDDKKEDDDDDEAIKEWTLAEYGGLFTVVKERPRETPVLEVCDVLVAGGGIAGIATAIAAARNGAKVILLEREFALGGLATLGLITIYLPICDGNGTQVVYGIGEELLKRSVEHVAEVPIPAAWLDPDGSKADRAAQRYIAQFNPHLFALSVERQLLELGVTILYGTLACKVVKSGDAITHVVVENKSGRSAIAVGSVIDCTGDADLCNLAGAETALHAGGNGLASWYYYYTNGTIKLKMFGLADIDPANYDKTDNVGSDGNGAYNPGGTFAALEQNVRFSGVDGAELSRANINARKLMYEDILKQRESDPELVPVTTPAIPEVRMSRRLVGESTPDVSSDHEHSLDSIGMTGDWRKRGPIFELPFSSMYTRKVANLLAAGRCISATDALWDVTRVIPPCAVTGEAAGVAAALLKRGESFAQLDIAALQAQLRSGGVRLHSEEL